MPFSDSVVANVGKTTHCIGLGSSFLSLSLIDITGSRPLDWSNITDLISGLEAEVLKKSIPQILLLPNLPGASVSVFRVFYQRLGERPPSTRRDDLDHLFLVAENTYGTTTKKAAMMS
jgi:hypothetical protein